jgi:hypothetical protein
VIQTFDFSEALRLMKRGYRMSRVVWNWTHYVAISDAQIFTAAGDIPNFDTADLLAEDWHLVDAEGGQ